MDESDDIFIENTLKIHRKVSEFLPADNVFHEFTCPVCNATAKGRISSCNKHQIVICTNCTPYSHFTGFSDVNPEDLELEPIDLPGFQSSSLRCPKCGEFKVKYRIHESLNGAFEDTQYVCSNCSHSWWVDGIDS